jgi:branched-chain amino acid transport system substrate-binding protein
MRRLLSEILLTCSLSLLSSVAWSDEPSLKIGVLEDMSGPYADVTGLGSVIAARMAVEDFGPVLGRKVEIISADHSNKADNGVAIAKRWIDVDGVEMIAGLGNTAVGLAVRGLASSTGKVDINTATAQLSRCGLGNS